MALRQKLKFNKKKAGLEIVGKAFPEAFERLRKHDMMYEPGVYGVSD